MSRTSRRRSAGKIADLVAHDEASLQVQQLAAYWNVSVATVRKWIRAGALPAFRVGRTVRVRRVDAVRFER